MSSLCYWGHKPDLVFEQMIGGDSYVTDGRLAIMTLP